MIKKVSSPRINILGLKVGLAGAKKSPAGDRGNWPGKGLKWCGVVLVYRRGGDPTVQKLVRKLGLSEDFLDNLGVLMSGVLLHPPRHHLNSNRERKVNDGHVGH